MKIEDAILLSEDHNTQWTSFKIKEPIELENNYGEFLCRIDGDYGYWLKHDWNYFKKDKTLMGLYQDLKINFDNERGKYDDELGFKYIWIYYFPSFKEKVSLSGLFKPLGFLGIGSSKEDYSDVVRIAWMHPYIRNHGLMKLLFDHMYKNEPFFVFEPPVSKTMKLLSQSVFKSLPKEKQFEIKNQGKEYQKNKFGLEFKDKTEEQIYAFLHMSKCFPSYILEDKESMQKLLDLLTDEVIEDMKKTALEMRKGKTEEEFEKEVNGLEEKMEYYKQLSEKKHKNK